MKNVMSKIVFFLIAVFVLSTIIYLFLFGTLKRSYRKRADMLKPFECSPKQLLPQLEVAYDITFPKELFEVRTAKSSIPDEGFVHFLVRFATEPNSVEKFLGTFSEEITFQKYDTNQDFRNQVARWEILAWYKTDIVKGKKVYSSLAGDATIYVDTSNSKQYILYFDGFYGVDNVPRKWYK